MSNPREPYYYGQPRPTLRSPAPQDTTSGLFNLGQGGRTVLPPLTSVVPTSRPPAPTTHSAQHPSQRPNQGQYDYSGPSSYMTGDWYNTSAPIQPQSSSYIAYQEPQPRYASPTYYPSHPARASPSVPLDAYDVRPVPGPSASQAVWDDRFQYPPSYPAGVPTPPLASTSHSGSSYDGRYQTPSYPASSSYPAASYSYNPQAQPTTSYSYSYTPAYEPRNSSSQVPFTGGYTQHAPVRSVSSVVRSTRPHAHAASYTPYSRHQTSSSSLHTPGTQPSTAGEEPIVKKKRKRADAAQLKVLNEMYDRTPFPTTAEREELARQLDMSARSVQIWFQNKRQSQRQGGRQSTATSSAMPQQQQVLAAPVPVPSPGIQRPSSVPRGPSAQYGVSPPRVGSATPGGVYDLRRSPTRVVEDRNAQMPSRSSRRRG